VETQEKTLKKGRNMKKTSILAQLALVGVAVGLLSAVPSMAADTTTTTTTMVKKHHKMHKKVGADSTAVAATADTTTTKTTTVKKHSKHKKTVVDSSAKM
jgi:hypothetical protein